MGSHKSSHRNIPSSRTNVHKTFYCLLCKTIPWCSRYVLSNLFKSLLSFISRRVDSLGVIFRPGLLFSFSSFPKKEPKKPRSYLPNTSFPFLFGWGPLAWCSGVKKKNNIFFPFYHEFFPSLAKLLNLLTISFCETQTL